MCPPNIGITTIADIFVGRPEHVLSIIGLVEHRRIVIADPAVDEEKSATAASIAATSLPAGSMVPTHVVRYSLFDDSIQVKPRLPLPSSSTDGIYTATPYWDRPGAS
jgi:hypothetical protein